jgi:hypothetical protein
MNVIKSTNMVAGGVWNHVPAQDLSAIGGVANDPNFGIRIVSAYHDLTGAYQNTNGTALNNNSGNIRLDKRDHQRDSSFRYSRTKQ